MMEHASPLLIACAITLAVAAVALPLLIRASARLGLLDHPGGRKQHVGVIPLVGGLTALVGLAAGALWYDGFLPFDRMLLLTSVALVVIGAKDDQHSLSVRLRILVQAIVILTMILATGVHVHYLGTLFGHTVELGWFGIPFTVFALIGLLNAFNLMDGIDGLAASLGLVAIVAILLTAGTPPAHGMAATLVLLGVALLPALVANLGLLGHRQRCFLGDAGSTLIGYLVGWGLIYFSQGPEPLMSPVSTLWCVALPVLDTLAVVYRRIRQHRSPFMPDRGHIHHLLRDSGFGSFAALLTLLVAAAAIWGCGVLARELGLAPGTNLAAFCLFALAYVLGTNRWYVRLHGHGTPVGNSRAAGGGMVLKMPPLARQRDAVTLTAANDPLSRDTGHLP